MNWLDETKECLKEHGKNMKDIVAVGGKDFQMPVEDFVRLADVDYDDGFGAPEVAEDLMLLGEDFFLERHEYDGSEWWEYKTLPKYIKDLPMKSDVRTVVNGSWSTLAELNSDKR